MFLLSVSELMQRAEEAWKKKGFYCEMDASFNGLESERERDYMSKKMQRKERGGTNGIHQQPIIFKSKSFQWAFCGDKFSLLLRRL